jgi:restriction system protein
VIITGHLGDNGIDGESTMPFLKVRVAFQAKRDASGNNVGIEPVQRLRGSMAGGFDRGIFITTSSFSAAARGWVEETVAPITLVDGEELVSQMVDLGLGVKTVPIVGFQLNGSFFADIEA